MYYLALPEPASSSITYLILICNKCLWWDKYTKIQNSHQNLVKSLNVLYEKGSASYTQKVCFPSSWQTKGEVYKIKTKTDFLQWKNLQQPEAPIMLTYEAWIGQKPWRVHIWLVSDTNTLRVHLPECPCRIKKQNFEFFFSDKVGHCRNTAGYVKYTGNVFNKRDITYATGRERNNLQPEREKERVGGGICLFLLFLFLF